jgi:hypothetical protein
MIDTLIPMTRFVLIRKEYWRNKSMEENGREMYCRAMHSKECDKYAEFLERKLELGMFIPCINGKPVEEPKKKYKGGGNAVGSSNSYTKEYAQYLKAKERVLFKGVRLVKGSKKYETYLTDADTKADNFWAYADNLKGNIESIINCGLELTETGEKESGLVLI